MPTPLAFFTPINAALSPGEEVIARESLGEGVARIKTAVAAALRQAMPDLQLRATDHFNHSFLPDFVIATDTATRPLYLRFECTSEHFAADVAYAGSSGGVFVGLTEQSANPQPQYEPLAVKDGHRCLVVPLTALALLAAHPTAQTQDYLMSAIGYCSVAQAVMLVRA